MNGYFKNLSLYRFWNICLEFIFTLTLKNKLKDINKIKENYENLGNTTMKELKNKKKCTKF